ncbi:universal stress protein [Ornithinimicrobium sediminis]|uniref:universal stress protein n=1 Tax=Ornithinimicrobium sediminis TaxID=2904603 RepID=UPI001E3F5702|nr:universal stress protein [Ornithinimicrobium sediminis]MCE0487222.1 universal stress protein [Ornithinimicrobium sediminis]
MNERKPVVVGYDGSSGSKYAVDWSARAAVRDRAPLVVVFAMEHVHLDSEGSARDSRRQALERAANDVVAEGAQRARVIAPAVEVSTRTSQDGAATALQELSADASLVVLGDRHRRRLHGEILGSVATAVAAHAHCTVVLVPDGSDVEAGPRHPVVVGVDGSDGSDLAAWWAADLAATTHAKLVIASAWQTPPADHWSRLYLVDDEWRHGEIDRARHSATWFVDHARNLVRRDHPGLQIEGFVEENRPGKMLTRFSGKASVVVVGSRGGGDLTSLLLGSVSRSVMHRSRCPVAIVR